MNTALSGKGARICSPSGTPKNVPTPSLPSPLGITFIENVISGIESETNKTEIDISASRGRQRLGSTDAEHHG